MVVIYSCIKVIMKEYFYKFLEWSNKNNVEITWFFLGFMLCDFFVKIGKNEYMAALFNAVILSLLYATRKLRM